MRRSSFACCTLWTLLALVAPALRANDGDLDPDFDGDGVFHYSDSGSFGSSLLRGPDGAAVVWGTRLTTAGVRQVHWRRVTESGADPLCAVGLIGDPAITARGAAFDDEGRLLIAAEVSFGPEPTLGVYRFLYPACQLDPDFAVNGVAMHDLVVADHGSPQVAGIATALWFQSPPGFFLRRILVVFAARTIDSNYDSFLVRLTNSGAIDTGFGGGDGIVAVAVGRRAMDFDRATDGRFLMTSELGATTPDLDTWLHKFDRDGVPDDTFSGDGVAVLDLTSTGDSYDRLPRIHAAADGRVVLAGVTDLGEQPGVFDQQAAIAVFRRDGLPESSWSGDGWTTFRPSGSYTSFFGASVLQGDGRLIVAGTSYDGPQFFVGEGTPDSLGFVMRFGRDGQVESGFGAGGAVVFDPDLVAGGADSTNGVALADDGRIWVKGTEQTPIGGDATAQRPFVALLRNSYIFADGFERGSTASW